MNNAAQNITVIMKPNDNVAICLCAAVTGFTEKALRRMIERGKLAKGIHYHKDSIGSITINLPEFNRLIEGS